MGRIDLLSLFQRIPTSLKVTSLVFSCVEISEFDNYYLSKNEYGNPVLLIKTEVKGTYPDIKLENLLVLFNKQCSIELNSNTTSGVFTIISLTTPKNNLKDNFLELLALTITHLGKNPNQKAIHGEMLSFIELFRALSEPARKTIQGLWAEVFLIESAKNTENFIKAWHLSQYAKIDFSIENESIEVKSSSNQKRIHYFSHEQLNVPKNQKHFIASLFIEEYKDGVSLEQLIKNIEIKVFDVELIYQLKSIIYKTLGQERDTLLVKTFDYNLAEKSLLFYEHSDIPNIKAKHIPREVLEVKLKINLDKIKQYYNLKIFSKKTQYLL